MTSHAAARRAAGLRPVHHHGVHDRRRPRPADHLAADALLPPATPASTSHRARLSEEGQRRAREPEGRDAVLGPDRQRDRKRPAGAGAGHGRRRRPRPRRQPRALQARDRGQAAGAASEMPPKAFDRFIHWYLTRIYIHVRPERIYVWADGDAVARAPAVRRAHGGGALRPRRGARRRPRRRPAAARWPGTSAWTSWASATRRRR